MRLKKYTFFIYLICCSWVISVLTIPSILDNNSINTIGLTTNNGVSKYDITQSVKYQVEVNFTFIHTRITSQQYYFKVARLDDRQPNAPLTPNCAPYQESKLLYNSITGYDIINKGTIDKFNNTYDQFNASLSQTETITLSQDYYITLNAVTFQSISDSDIGTYNMSNEIFELYCNNTEDYYERDEPDLIDASNNIVDPSDNPVEKAEKICNWVSSYLTYDGNLPPQEKGALWALNNGRGDCSEFSSLMVTLLRIQDIPARKVTGFCISANPKTRPSIGQRWTFYAYKIGDTVDYNFLGHAWVEYYVPNIGWIASDPTWHSGGYDYFNHIDYLRFNTNVGANFFLPGASPGYEYASEFPFIPSAVCIDHDAYNFDYQVKITVLESTVGSLSTPFIPITIIVVSAVVIVGLVVVIMFLRGRRKKRDLYQY